MTERKQILKLSVITDDDCGMYQLGEIDGGFCHAELKDYLKHHKEYGFQQLLKSLAYIQRQVLYMNSFIYENH
jgi:hypothetical protein